MLPAGLDRDPLREMLRVMVLARAADEQLRSLVQQRLVEGQSRVARAQEAGAVGAAGALRRRTDGKGDVVAGTSPATGAVFLFGGTPLEYFRQHLARATSPGRGRAGNDHGTDLARGILGPVSSPGTMLEVMAGVTLSFRLKGEDRVGLVFGSAGDTATGAWHEGLNFAAVQRCPLILVLEAEESDSSRSSGRQTRLASFVEKAAGYGIVAESVDRHDILAIFDASRRAVLRARAGEGVSMIELRSMEPEVTPSGDSHAAPAREGERVDPILLFHDKLLAEGWASKEEFGTLLRSVRAEVLAAAEQAIAEPTPTAISALEDVYADHRTPAPWSRTPLPALQEN